jgi:hypothetical protein
MRKASSKSQSDLSVSPIRLETDAAVCRQSRETNAGAAETQAWVDRYVEFVLRIGAAPARPAAADDTAEGQANGRRAAGRDGVSS